MTIWHRNRRGRGCTTPRCRSQNIANNTFSEGWLQKSNEFAGLRTAPATHHAKNTANTFSCGMLQNAGFGTIPCGGGGGGSEPRTGIIYIYICKSYLIFDYHFSYTPEQQALSLEMNWDLWAKSRLLYICHILLRGQRVKIVSKSC